jgi:DNA-directed RNA polymerase subunit RPC12/RpoP
MYSIEMLSGAPLYRCRLCGAATYRRLVQRGPTGAMEYANLYRCSGCSVTFTDPSAWRESSAPAAVRTAAPSVSETRSQYAAPTDGPNLSTWGSASLMPVLPNQYGHSKADLQAIREAAARANKGKRKGLRG